MRLISLAVIASLALAPGCAVMAAPPIIGATVGLITAATEDPARHPSFGGHAVVGTLIGLAADVVLLFVAVTYTPDIFSKD